MKSGNEGDEKPQIVGEVLETQPPERLVLSWASPDQANDPAQVSRVTFQIEPSASMVKLTVTHDQLIKGSDMANKISQGWTWVLSSLKSFLETGEGLAPGTSNCSTKK